ncbi:MAG: amidohydrolase family protein [Actinomycetota bacterium]|nr:amidohydrolase family protein [Actinomycetota bacterium]
MDPDAATGAATELLSRLRLVDSHCHPLLARATGPGELERFFGEGDRPLPQGVSAWDSPIGLAIRRWCAPALDLDALASPSDYLERRAALGVDDVAGRLLGAAHLSHLLVDTGIVGPDLADRALLGEAAGATVSEVVRLERVAEDLATSGVEPEGFAAAYVDRLGVACSQAAAVKSVVAYRHGLDVDPARPGPAEVRAAAEEWLAQRVARLSHPVLLRFVLWAGIDLRLPLQIHTGFGDRDILLQRSDPSLLQPLLTALEPSEVPVVLLHCYPYHRQAGWLTTVYPSVYADVGLTVGQVGAGAAGVLGEFFELAPVAKLMFSTDGYRLPEHFLVGAAQFRHSLGRLLDGRVAEGALTIDDAERAARMVSADNARRVYTRLASP